MKKIAVFIIGTSPLPIYISMKRLESQNFEKIYFLATMDDQYSKGTMIYAERLMEVFTNKKIEILNIHRSNLTLIECALQNVFNTILEYCEEVEVSLDFTGGTKLQSAYIRESFERNIANTKDSLVPIYVDGYLKKVFQYNNINNNDGKKFENIVGSKDLESLKDICYLHGFKIEHFPEYVEVKNMDNSVVYRYDDIYLEKYNVCFVNTLKNFDKDNSKRKMELFKNIVDSELIGGAFCVVDIIVPKGKYEEKNRNLINEFLGIKQNLYKDRILFNSK